jgi:hypothetical protein
MFFFAYSAYAQDEKKSVTEPVQSGSKSQDHNSSRSNKTSSVAAPDLNSKVETENKETTTNAGNTSSSKKGYDYYKANSDVNSAKPIPSTTKAQDYNSSRSNKTSSIAAPNDKIDTVNNAFNQNSSRSNNPQPKK